MVWRSILNKEGSSLLVRRLSRGAEYGMEINIEQRSTV